ncbi:MAG: alkyl hydroperoxide reductase subunit C [Actinomycetota bacterium]
MPSTHRADDGEQETTTVSLIGSTIQPFTTTAYHGGEFVDVSSDDLAGRWSVVFFYPADFTFVCPTELGDLAELYSDFQAAGVEIYAVSTDTHFTHKAWHSSSDTVGRVQYPMLGDPTGAISRAFDVMIDEAGLADRATFVIDPDGVIQVMELSADGIGRNATELLRKVRAAKYVRENPDEVCPANWEEGAETLTPGLDLVGKI